MTLSALTILIFGVVAVLILVIGLWAYATANRLDRLHVRSDLAWQSLDSALARPLLQGGGDLVLAKLRSQGMAERQSSRRFLVQLAGHDLGESPAAWEEWMRGL